MTHRDAATAIRREEAAVEARSAALAKELGLIDLTLTQVLFIVGLPWVGVAAKLGPSHVIFWLIAMVFFYVPSAVVVVHLNGAMPLEGGLYQWAKLGFNELIGFLVAWNLWLFAILNTSETGLQVTQYLVYIIGPGGAWLTDSKWFITLVSAVLIGALVVITVVGFGVGKWVHKAGGVLMLGTFATLMLLPWVNVALGSLLSIRVAQASVMFAGNTRLPMVAGWDRLLPDWFTRFHSRYHTPVNSIVFVGAATFALSIAGLIGVGKQEAFQLLWNASAIFYALTYLVMFSIPLFGRSDGQAPPLWLRASALSGFAMTLLFVVLSILPIVQVQSRVLFALKLSSLIVLTHIVGLAIFLGPRHLR